MSETWGSKVQEIPTDAVSRSRMRHDVRNAIAMLEFFAAGLRSEGVLVPQFEAECREVELALLLLSRFYACDALGQLTELLTVLLSVSRAGGEGSADAMQEVCRLVEAISTVHYADRRWDD